MKLFEINYRNMSGPGDYRPGDEYDPRSPDYDPEAGQRRDRPTHQQVQADKNDAFEQDQKIKARWQAKRDQAQAAKITDAKRTQEYPHGEDMAPVTTYSGIAADMEAAKTEVNRTRYGAYEFYGDDYQELPDGRVKFAVRYMQ